MAMEREMKLAAETSFELPELDGIAGLAAYDRGVRVLDATYWDTDDLALLRSGHGLRFRTTDGGSGRWTLKAGSHREGDLMVRDELELEGTPEALPAEIRERVARVVELDRLRPVATLQTRRHIVDLEADGAPWAEVADDAVSVRDGEREAERFREVEVELRGDTGRARLEAVLARLRAAGASGPTSSSKYARALAALGHDIGDATGADL